VVFGCGGGAVLLPENRDLLHEHSLTVWLYATIKTTLRRVPPGTRPLLAVENPTDTARKILTERLSAYARAADIVVSSENRIEEVAEKIYEEIGQTFKD
jgi:shikimate kinase